MARPLRIEYAGAFYHVFSRGNNKQDIFADDTDRLFFLANLMAVCERLDWWVWSYCLMNNHYHLLLRTHRPNLSRGMRDVNGTYAQEFNRRHDRVGHLFQARYKGLLVDNEAYLSEICRYLVLNPVRAGFCQTVGGWRWSSYSDTLRGSSSLRRLAIDSLLDRFAPSRDEGRLRYVEFVAAGVDADPPAGTAHSRTLVADQPFEAGIVAHIPRPAAEVPRPERPRFTLAHYANCSTTLTDAMRAAYASGAYSQSEIAAYFGLHYSTVSRVVNWRSQKQESRPGPLTIQDLAP
jgi:REP element-mobilizing transposase RayT